MSVLEQVQSDVKDAMKAGERERVHALRLIVSELQKAAKDNGGDEVQADLRTVDGVVLDIAGRQFTFPGRAPAS